MTKTYYQMLDWTAALVWRRTNYEGDDALGWRSTIGDAVSVLAEMFDRTAYDVNHDVWQRVEEIYGNPYK